ncbi:hypothetical protein HanIR_Chr17g0899301 [Helianthus annuus]|nr:hypothetical protein HanIR_Chr17g0899301 [Helianthus annuus]
MNEVWFLAVSILIPLFAKSQIKIQSSHSKASVREFEGRWTCVVRSKKQERKSRLRG